MQCKRSQRGEPPQDCADQDPSQVLAATITYLDNNQSRGLAADFGAHGKSGEGSLHFVFLRVRIYLTSLSTQHVEMLSAGGLIKRVRESR
ncbi:MAG: hypothetical protein ABI614_28430 [Planctomycetota bacterium]